MSTVDQQFQDYLSEPELDWNADLLEWWGMVEKAWKKNILYYHNWQNNIYAYQQRLFLRNEYILRQEI